MLIIFICVISFFFQFRPILLSIHLIIMISFLIYFCASINLRFYIYIFGILILRGLCVLFYYVSCVCFDNLDFFYFKKTLFLLIIFFDIHNIFIIDTFASLSSIKSCFSIDLSIYIVGFIITYLFIIIVIVLKICKNNYPLRFF